MTLAARWERNPFIYRDYGPKSMEIFADFVLSILTTLPGKQSQLWRRSAEQENESPSLLARRPRKGPLGAGMSWEDCREEGTQQSEPIILCMNSWVLFQNSICASDSKQHAKC